jgi:hypothetical protein
MPMKWGFLEIPKAETPNINLLLLKTSPKITQHDDNVPHAGQIYTVSLTVAQKQVANSNQYNKYTNKILA